MAEQVRLGACSHELLAFFFLITVPRATIKRVFLVDSRNCCCCEFRIPPRVLVTCLPTLSLGPASLLVQQTPTVRPHPDRTRENYGRFLKLKRNASPLLSAVVPPADIVEVVERQFLF